MVWLPLMLKCRVYLWELIHCRRIIIDSVRPGNDTSPLALFVGTAGTYRRFTAFEYDRLLIEHAIVRAGISTV